VRDKLSNLGVLLVVLALILSACGPATDEPIPAPTAPSGQESEQIPDAAGARDVALLYIAEKYSDQAPPSDLTWGGGRTTPEGLVGSETYEYVAGDWEVTITYPTAAPEDVIYRAMVVNHATGFQWEGELGEGRVMNVFSVLMGSEPQIPDPTQARDAALAYVAEAYPDEAPFLDLVWSKDDTTPQGLVGRSEFRYAVEDWVVTVSFNLVAPQNMIYEIGVSNETTGFHWEGEVDARGQVTEMAGPAGQPATPVEVSDADLAELVRGNSAFAFDLYQVLREGDGNLFYSPHSISLALAMTYAGARGETEAQMANALQFLLAQERLHPAFDALGGELASREEAPARQGGEGFRLHVVNTLWGQEGFEFLSQFLDLLADSYGAGLRRLDFASDPEEARLTINDWVSDQTEDRIEDLIAPGVIDALTRLVLTNAIYFNAAWANPFRPEATQDGPFYLLDGSEVTAPMMSKTASFAYTGGEGYQAIELRYVGGQLSMLILLPEAGAFEAFEDTLDDDRVAAVLKDLGHQEVALTLPRFEFESGFSLKDALADLGMPAAFTGAADFSGMTGNRDLFISEVVHKAFVAVDEEGTEAAAATAVMMPLGAAPGQPVEFTIDRPFLFLIRDIETGAILFVGRVLNPSV
jgi:serpin B